MTPPGETRPPRVFAPDDPKIVRVTPDTQPVEGVETGEKGLGSHVDEMLPPAPSARTGIGWVGLLITALAALAGLAASVGFARFAAVALERQDWIGWTATGLLAVAALSALVIIAREIVGLVRLARLVRLKTDIDKALLAKDRGLERAVVQQLRALYSGRRELRWALARLRDHEGDVGDAGDLLTLAERELLAPIDLMARRAVLRSAKRVSVVTALSPMAWVAMLYVVFENLRMLKGLAGLYGGRPGGLGALRLGRMVMTHILATGGLALTDDLLGQFLGQDLLRRLSRRLGEGAFNGAMTARIGTAAIEVTRPLPFIAATPVRLRDLMAELFRRREPKAAKERG